MITLPLYRSELPVDYLVDKFAELATPEPNSGCWLWLGKLNGCGYGVLYCLSEPHSVLAHRIAYALEYGRVPANFCVLHTCDMRCCVNPAHLFLGTQAHNVADMEEKGRGRHPQREMHGRAKLSWSDVRAIRADTRSSRELGRVYSVSKTNILAIRGNRIWREG